MDEQQLQDLLRDAPEQAPPATFDIDEVRAAARRARARRRWTVAGACALVVVALAGAGILGIMMTTGGTGQVVASKPEGNPTRGGKSDNAAPAQPQPEGTRLQDTASAARPTKDLPGLSPKQGGDGTVKDGPRAGSTDGCDKVDRELAKALADELPVTGSDAQRSCASDVHAVTFRVGGGSLTATLVDDKLPSTYHETPGAVTVTRHTAGGGTLMLVSIAGDNGGTPPLSGELTRVAEELAARF